MSKMEGALMSYQSLKLRKTFQVLTNDVQWCDKWLTFAGEGVDNLLLKTLLSLSAKRDTPSVKGYA
jgi:hypothetical protein